MDFTSLLSLFNMGIMVVLLSIGYIIKHSPVCDKIPNDYIPSILAVLGAVLYTISYGVSVDNVGIGLAMGLATTGFHEAYKSFVEGK